jgi:hypothetical protein
VGHVSEDFGDVVFRAIQRHALCSQAKKELLEEEKYNKMLRPGFEPGISDSKGRYA